MTVPAAEEPGVLSGALRLRNPIVAASETFGYGLEFAPLVHLRRLGGLVVKGLSRESMGGAPAPRLCETPAGMLNAVGLQNIGVRAFLKEKFPELRECDTTMVANVFGYATEDYVGVIRALEDAEGLAAEVTQAPRKAARRPLWVQLFPLVPDISAIARAVEGTGADAVTVANAQLAMGVDLQTRRSRIGSLTGGLSGPADRPITLRQVLAVGRSIRTPVIGLGGIESPGDGLEYLVEGATAVQVGKASFAAPTATGRILGWLERSCEKYNVRSISELR